MLLLSHILGHIIGLLIGLVNIGSAKAEIWPTVDTAAKQAIIIDWTSQNVLLEKHADELTPPSSMTKIMTTYLILKRLKAGAITMNTLLPVSHHAWQMGGSKMFVPLGAQVRIADLLRGIIVQSGNDACVVVAEGLAGSEAAFVQEMMAEVKRLGLRHTVFKNPHGWPEEGHLSTVRDLSILASRLIEDFPQYYSIHQEPTFRYNNIRQFNRNPLLRRNIGCDGIKTGHTSVGGYGLAASTLVGKQRLILVINGLKSKRARASEALKLLTWAQNTFITYRPFSRGQAILQIPVVGGKESSVELKTATDVAFTIPKAWSGKVKVEIERPNFIIAPFKAGESLGKIVVSLPDNRRKTFPLVAAQDISKGNFFKRLFSTIYWLCKK